MSKSNARKAWDEIDREAKEHPHAPGVINGNRLVRSTLESLGVYFGVKCREWFINRGEKIPVGTPSYALMEIEHKRRISRKAVDC